MENKTAIIRTGLWCLDAKKWGWDLLADDFYMCNLGSSAIASNGYDTSEEAAKVAKQYADLLNLEIV